MAVEKFIPIHDATAPAPEDERLAAFSSPCEGKEPYVLMVLGDSMEPEFMEGDVVVIEPHNRVTDGSYVIAWHRDEYILRRLRMIADRLYLEPLNAHYTSDAIESLDQIKGVITQRKRPGGGRRNMKRYL